VYSSDSEVGQDDHKILKIAKYPLGQKIKGQIRNGKGTDSGFSTSRRDSSASRKSSSSASQEETETEQQRRTVKCYPGHLNSVDQNQNNIELIKSPTVSQFAGFGLLPDQVYSKAVRKGFEFSFEGAQ
jgi:hypothetical protein